MTDVTTIKVQGQTVWFEALTDEQVDDPEDADAYHNRGTSYYFLGEYQLAIDSYAEAMRLNPQHPTASQYRYMAYKQLNESG